MLRSLAPALSLGWSLGGTYELGLIGVGAVVLVGAVAMSHQGERAFSASVILWRVARWARWGCRRWVCAR